MAKLTDKQRRFVEEYLIDLNATQAAIRAGYSVKTAKEIAAQNLTKLNISNEIAKAMAERSRRTGVSADRVIEELAKMVVNICDVVDVTTGRVCLGAKKDDLASVQSIKIKETEFGTEQEIKLYDKKSALELLGKHLGIFTDKIDLNANVNTEKFDDVISQLGGDGLDE
ncbi:MAG: terminase small subunit [Peptostreptococcus anaerobius]